jgi:hypothetical protein
VFIYRQSLQWLLGLEFACSVHVQEKFVHYGLFIHACSVRLVKLFSLNSENEHHVELRRVGVC